MGQPEETLALIWLKGQPSGAALSWRRMVFSYLIPSIISGNSQLRGPELWPTNPQAQEGLRKFALPDGVLGYAQVEKWLKGDTNAFDLDEKVC